MGTTLVVVLLFILLLALAVCFISILVRGLILFPVESLKKGRHIATAKYGLSLFFSIFILILELPNLTGFSLQRMRIVSDKELINTAIEFVYHDIYKDRAEFKSNYSRFEPKARYWGSWYWKMDSDLVDKLLGFTRYQVLLPDAVVIFDVAGTPLFTRAPTECGLGDSGCTVIPDNPEQGIVGTVQLGPPDYKPASKQDLSIEWNGEVATDMKTWGDKRKDQIFMSGHCFSAYIKSPKLYDLKVKAKGQDVVTINQGYGFYLVTILESNSYGLHRISKEFFLKSQHCDADVRKDWPNVGGGSWVR